MQDLFSLDNRDRGRLGVIGSSDHGRLGAKTDDGIRSAASDLGICDLH